MAPGNHPTIGLFMEPTPEDLAAMESFERLILDRENAFLDLCRNDKDIEQEFGEKSRFTFHMDSDGILHIPKLERIEELKARRKARLAAASKSTGQSSSGAGFAQEEEKATSQIAIGRVRPPSGGRPARRFQFLTKPCLPSVGHHESRFNSMKETQEEMKEEEKEGDNAEQQKQTEP